MSCTHKFSLCTVDSSEFDTNRELHRSIHMRQRAASNIVSLVSEPRMAVVHRHPALFFVIAKKPF